MYSTTFMHGFGERFYNLLNNNKVVGKNFIFLYSDNLNIFSCIKNTLGELVWRTKSTDGVKMEG